jgi:hypothetical protein
MDGADVGFGSLEEADFFIEGQIAFALSVERDTRGFGMKPCPVFEGRGSKASACRPWGGDCRCKRRFLRVLSCLESATATRSNDFDAMAHNPMVDGADELRNGSRPDQPRRRQLEGPHSGLSRLLERLHYCDCRNAL